jgi:hypothetical protein
MTDLEQPEFKKSKSWPTVVATSVGGLVVAAFRGCWHSNMSWPVGVRGYSYQVCLGCGAKRLFDEDEFRAHGPFRYDLNEFTAYQYLTRGKFPFAPNGRFPPF